MSQPHGFSWIEKPLLAAMGRPDTREEYQWLRDQGIQVVIALTEDPPRRDWINEAGLMLVHVPIVDMEAPTPAQIEICISTIQRAHERQMGVSIHCSAGLGRTGTMVACYLVTKQMSAQNAIARVRRLRPGSVETEEQADAILEFSRRQYQSGGPAE